MEMLKFDVGIQYPWDWLTPSKINPSLIYSKRH